MVSVLLIVLDTGIVFYYVFWFVDLYVCGYCWFGFWCDLSFVLVLRLCLLG